MSGRTSKKDKILPISSFIKTKKSRVLFASNKDSNLGSNVAEKKGKKSAGSSKMAIVIDLLHTCVDTTPLQKNKNLGSENRRVKELMCWESKGPTNYNHKD